MRAHTPKWDVESLVWLLIAKVVCCGGLLLAAMGVLSLGAIGTWLVDGGLIWLVIGILAAAAYLWQRRFTRARIDTRSRGPGTREEQ